MENNTLHKLGIDIGSTTVKIAILDGDDNILFSDYERHFANIQETLASLIFKACKTLGDLSVSPVITGSGVLTPAESQARYEVLNETYVKKLQIEARVIGDVCLNHVIPAAVSYQNILIKSIQGCKDVFGDDFKTLCKADMETYKNISGFVNKISEDVEALVEARKKANKVEDMSERAKLYSTEVKEEMDKVRYSADHLEMLVDDELWPLPKYRELLFF